MTSTILSSLLVRSATAADAGILTSNNIAMALETEGLSLRPDLVSAGVEAALLDPDKASYFVAESGGVPAGSLMVTREWSDWRNGWFWWIQSVYILPSYRRQGVYSALYRHVESTARQTPEVCGLRLYVAHENLPAQEVYHRLGMERTGYHLFEVSFLS